jgi:hypothetical protein
VGTGTAVSSLSTTVPSRESSGKGVVVFLGPSLDRETAAGILPEAVFLPPVCQGQLQSAVDRYHPALVAMIDGEFSHTLSVWHKEVLLALSSGVRVVGSSSMGALRAAECDVYGMEGVGRIYEWYREGLLTDDDEVALVHAPAEEAWRNFSWPLVNVRATTELLCRQGTIDDTTAAAVVQVLKGLYFPNRHEAALADELRRLGFDRATEIANQITQSYVDQKRLDAIELLTLVASGRSAAPVPQWQARDSLGWLVESLLLCDTEVVRSRGSVLRHEIIDHAALFEKDFDVVQERALHRALVIEYAEELGLQPTVEEVAAERQSFLARRDLSEETLATWLAGNDLSSQDFEGLVYEEAQAHRMRKWFLHTKGYERNRGAVSTELRLEGRYPEVADRAARQSTLTAACDVKIPSDLETTAKVLVEHRTVTGWNPSVPLPQWIEEHGFGSHDEFLFAMVGAADARREADRRRERIQRILGNMVETADGQG